MASGWELPAIGDGRKASQVYIYPILPAQTDLFCEPIWVQAHHSINCGLKVGTDAQDYLTAMGYDWASHGKWFDLWGQATLQRRMPEENEDYHWRTVHKWLLIPGMTFENVFGSESESCYYRIGVLGADWTDGQGILRIGTS